MMLLDINKLIESKIDEVREIGWLLYHEDIEEGLSKENTYKIIEKLAAIKSNELEIYTETDLEKARDEGYDNGFEEAKCIYDVECDCCC